LETGLQSKTFEDFLKTFGDNKTATTDMLSSVMSKHKLSINVISEMKIDINNIQAYDERD
jgi:hypothetical protein